MRKAAIQWLKSAQMDLDNIAQIIDLEHQPFQGGLWPQNFLRRDTPFQVCGLG